MRLGPRAGGFAAGRGTAFRRGLCLLLGIWFLAGDVSARPGGGSGFGGGGRSSGGSRSSGGGSRSTPRSPSRDDSSSGGASRSTPAKPAVPTFSYCVKYAADRGDARRLWHAGTLGPYGSGPPRPAELRVEQPGDVAIGATILLVLGFVGLAVPIGIVAGVVMLVRKRRGSGWTTAAPLPQASGPSPGEVRRALAAIRGWDPDFSVALFEDFAYALYAEAHTARGAGTLPRLAPYLGQPARTTLEALGRRPVSAVVVGAMRHLAFSPNGAGGQRVDVQVEFEACYTERAGPSQEQSFYCIERWRFVRSRSARSRSPDRIRVFTCPSCGAPLDRVVGSVCGYCSRVVDGGSFDWTVEGLEVVQRSARPPILTGTTEEAGTSLRTVFDPGLGAALASLKARDPAFQDSTLFARVDLIFRTMQAAWTSLAWEGARAYLTDSLFQANSYWIGAYRAQGLRNVTQNARILGLELVRIDSDRWFDTVTVRVHASGLDYTIRDADGALVGGNRQKERPYSEYWTLVRGAARKGAAGTQPVCPNCSAPMNVSMAALCAHCGVKVNSGEFDWVLSRIEQDEAYGG